MVNNFKIREPMLKDKDAFTFAMQNSQTLH